MHTNYSYRSLQSPSDLGHYPTILCLVLALSESACLGLPQAPVSHNPATSQATNPTTALSVMPRIGLEPPTFNKISRGNANSIPRKICNKKCDCQPPTFHHNPNTIFCNCQDTPHRVLHLDDDRAFTLGIMINIARRQMSSEQIKELQKNLKKDRENLRKVALVLRKKNKSQEEVAAILGVPRTTLEGWEQGQITTIDESVIGCNPPDLRIKVPKKEYETIYQRVEDIRAYGLASMLSLSLDC